MGENAEGDQVKEKLIELNCHFTWVLFFEDLDIPDLEMRISENLEFLDIKNQVGMFNLRAYVNHLKGQHEEALQSLKEAEALIQEEQLGQRSLVTWSNCAWVHYHMGRLAETQTYLDKVENTCTALGSPFRYSMECAEMEYENQEFYFKIVSSRNISNSPLKSHQRNCLNMSLTRKTDMPK